MLRGRASGTSGDPRELSLTGPALGDHCLSTAGLSLRGPRRACSLCDFESHSTQLNRLSFLGLARLKHTLYCMRAEVTLVRGH